MPIKQDEAKASESKHVCVLLLLYSVGNIGERGEICTLELMLNLMFATFCVHAIAYAISLSLQGFQKLLQKA